MTIPRPLADRFWEKVDVRAPDECWPWLGAVHWKGYGLFHAGKYRDDRKAPVDYAHRVALFLAGEPPPFGVDVHHLCENKLCANPSHMRVLTDGEHYDEHDFSRFLVALRKIRDEAAVATSDVTR